MILYVDTSALVKLVLREPGTTEMENAADDAEGLVSASITYVELRAAVASAVRDGRLPPRERDQAVSAVEDLWAGVSAIDIDTPLLRHAGDLAERMRLRGYDAVHLAALLRAGQPGDLSLACWDADLRRAARELGYGLTPAE